MPSSGKAGRVSGCTPVGVVPALAGTYPPPPRTPSSASAIWLRAELPTQTKRTRSGAAGWGGFMAPLVCRILTIGATATRSPGMAKKGNAAKEPKAVKPSKAERAEAKRQKRVARLEDQLNTAPRRRAGPGRTPAAPPAHG